VDADVITLIWIAVGLLFIAIELFVPGLVVVFMGLGALAVALLRWIGVVEGLPASFITWLISSVVMVVSLRGTLRKWFPPEESHKVDDEDVRGFGQLVEVLEDIVPADDDSDKPAGRVRFEGTSWPAATTEGVIKKGQRARLVYRQDLAWIVEPVGELTEGDGVRVPDPEDRKER
jgi:membrane protein implicated in regulation of membrane protease activity